MKTSFTLLAIVISSICCAPNESHFRDRDGKNLALDSGVTYLSSAESSNGVLDTKKPPQTCFDVKVRDTTLNACLDSRGEVSVTNYPKEWHGRMSLVRYDGQSSAKSPFSKTHCQEIKMLAKHGMRLLVRGGFHALLMLDNPPFLADDIMSVILNSAQAAGIDSSFLTITNPVHSNRSVVALELTQRAISGALGELSAIETQLNIGKSGMGHDPSQKRLVVTSGDIICDLISGAGQLIILYPVPNENRTIKVIYDPLVVQIPPK